MSDAWSHLCESHPAADYRPAVDPTPTLLKEYQDLVKAGVKPTDVKSESFWPLGGTTAETLTEPDGSSLRVHFKTAGGSDVSLVEKRTATGELAEKDDWSHHDYFEKTVTAAAGLPNVERGQVTVFVNHAQNYYAIARENGNRMITWDDYGTKNQLVRHEIGRNSACAENEREFWMVTRNNGMYGKGRMEWNEKVYSPPR